jgi:hypothetical protein
MGSDINYKNIKTTLVPCIIPIKILKEYASTIEGVKEVLQKLPGIDSIPVQHDTSIIDALRISDLFCIKRQINYRKQYQAQSKLKTSSIVSISADKTHGLESPLMASQHHSKIL